MKKIVASFVLFTSLIFATTYHTITIDGTSDFSLDEEFSTSSSGFTAYITWDANNLYFGMNGADVPWISGGSEKVAFIYIDTDPQTTPTNGTGSSTSIAWGISNTLPFTANYSFYWKKQAWEWGLRKSTDWNSNITYTGGTPGRNVNMVEFKIPKSDIGNPEKIYVLIYFQDSDNGLNNWVWANCPSANSGGQGSQTFTHYYGYNLIDNVNPNDGSNLDEPLPVELFSITALVSAKGVNLNWKTATEVNNFGFSIERRTNSEEWTNLGFVNGAGNSNSPKEYTYVDETVTSGNYIYRLKQIDNDGQFKYSNEIEIAVNNIAESFKLEQNFPNPFNPTTSIKFGFNEDTEVNLVVFDQIGNQVASLFKGKADAGRIYNAEFNAAGLASGIYFYKLETPRRSEIRKMLLMK